MTISDAQADLRRSYVGGGPGAFISGLLWFVAAWVEARHGVEAVRVVLTREAEVTKTWDALLEARGDRR